MNNSPNLSRWLRSHAQGKKAFCLLPFAFCLAMGLLAIMTDDASACPMCKAALGSQDGTHGDWVGGFFWSILFMLSMPFLIFTSLSAYMYVLVRRARHEADERKAAALRVENFVDRPLEFSEVGTREPATVDHA